MFVDYESAEVSSAAKKNSKKLSRKNTNISFIETSDDVREYEPGTPLDSVDYEDSGFGRQVTQSPPAIKNPPAKKKKISKNVRSSPPPAEDEILW